MPDSTLANLTAAGTLGGSDLFYVVQSGNDRKATGTQVAALAGSVADPYDFDTKAAVTAASIGGGVNYVRIAGYNTVGDGGASMYKRVGSQPGHALWISSNSGTVFWAWCGDAGGNPILTPEMAGAVGDATFSEGSPSIAWTGTDNTVALQNAIDAVTYFRLADRLSFRFAGTQTTTAQYRITATLQCGYGDQFITTRIEGPGRATGSGFSPLILCDFSNGVGIALNGQRDFMMQGITLWGRNWDWIATNAMGAVNGANNDDTIFTNWVGTAVGGPTMWAGANNQYTQYCGVCVDPYAGPAPASNPYPNITRPSYAGGGTIYNNGAPSSNTLIRNCGIHGFVVGVGVQTSNVDSNGDFTRLDNCQLENNSVCIAVGNTQSREVSAQGTSFSNSFCVLDTARYGHQSGKAGGVFAHCDASQCINLINLCSTSISGPLIFINQYMEASWRIGDITPTTGAETSIIFDSCQLDFSGQNDARGVPATMFGSFNQPVNIKFRGGVLTNFIRVASLFFQSGDNLEFDGTMIQSAFIGNGNTPLCFQALAHNATGGGIVMAQLGNLSARPKNRLKFTQFNADTLAPDSAQIVGPRQQYANRPHCACAWVEKAIPVNGEDEEGVWIPKIVNFIDKSTVTGASFTNKQLVFSMASGYTTAQFETLGPSNGDVLWDDQTGTVFWVRARTGLQVTAELQNNYKASGGGNYSHPTAMTLNTGYWYILNSRLYTPTTFLRGNFSSSANTVTSVGDAQGNNGNVTTDIQANDYIWNDDTRDDTLLYSSGNTKLSSVASATLTMPANAVTTLAKRRLAWFIRTPHANE